MTSSLGIIEISLYLTFIISFSVLIKDFRLVVDRYLALVIMLVGTFLVNLWPILTINVYPH